MTLSGEVGRGQSGQSLIETIVAIFILTTGLSAGLALAIYAFGGSSEIAERVTAAGLAREGTEAVRRMRDSNWLRDTLSSGGSCGSGQFCYRNWLRTPYDIRGSSGRGRSYRLEFNPSATAAAKWGIRTGSGGDFYRLYRQSTGAVTHSNVSGGQPTNFFRKVTIVDRPSPSPPRILVRSTVWWYGKKCNNTLTDLTNPSETGCKIISEEYLTNWKNY